MNRYQLYGDGGSPYSMKMRAVLRYRRLPHNWVQLSQATRKNLVHDGPPVIPILQLPEDGSLHVDSTPLCYLLEERHADRSILPGDLAVAYLCELIEDMADEWCTKMMFHYRWSRDIDRTFSSRWIISDNSPGLRGSQLQAAAKAISDRQVSRMPLVGCTIENAPMIESGYMKVLKILDGFAARDQYLFGTRPSLADFGLFGQFKTLATDHTPMMIMRSETPAVYTWIQRLDDASGIEGEWHDAAELRPEVAQLLAYTGKYYLPFLQRNATAYAEGKDTLAMEIDGQSFSQAPFKYQVKCYDRLQKRYRALTQSDRSRIEPLLSETGCLPYLT